MNVDGFITTPSFRPDGRLDRLNHGGGSKVPKTIPGEPKRFQNQPDLIRLMALAAHQSKDGNKTKQLDYNAGYNGGPYGVKPKVLSSGKKTQSAGGVGNGTAGSASASGAAGAVYTQETAPAGTVAGGTLRKKRTLLSGGGRSFGQPYGSDTILGG
jgi:hypothetical protein